MMVGRLSSNSNLHPSCKKIFQGEYWVMRVACGFGQSNLIFVFKEMIKEIYLFLGYVKLNIIFQNLIKHFFLKEKKHFLY